MLDSGQLCSILTQRKLTLWLILYKNPVKRVPMKKLTHFGTLYAAKKTSIPYDVIHYS